MKDQNTDNLSHTQVIKDMNIHNPLLNMTPSQLEEKIINRLYLYCPTIDGFQDVFKQACQSRRTKEELATSLVNQSDRGVEYGDRAKFVKYKGEKTQGVAKEESSTVPTNIRELLRNVLCGDSPTSSNSVGLEQKPNHLNKNNMLVYDPGGQMQNKLLRNHKSKELIRSEVKLEEAGIKISTCSQLRHWQDIDFLGIEPIAVIERTFSVSEEGVYQSG